MNIAYKPCIVFASTSTPENPYTHGALRRRIRELDADDRLVEAQRALGEAARAEDAQARACAEATWRQAYEDRKDNLNLGRLAASLRALRNS